MRNPLARVLYFLIFIVPAVYTACNFYGIIPGKPDYSLTLKLKSVDKIIERTDANPELRLLFNDQEIQSLFLTTFQLKNTGKYAIAKDFILSPIKLVLGLNNKLLKISSVPAYASTEANSIIISWDLLNPGEEIRLSALSSEFPSPEISQRIKNISKVDFVDEIKNPPIDRRAGSLVSTYLWLVAFVLLTLDGMLLILHDKELGPVLKIAEELGSGVHDKQEYLNAIITAYKHYYNSTPLLFVSPKLLKSQLSKMLAGMDKLEGKRAFYADYATIRLVRHGNLYDTRTKMFFAGPIGALLCIGYILYKLFV